MTHRILARMENHEREWTNCANKLSRKTCRPATTCLMTRSGADHRLKREVLTDLFEVYPIEHFNGDNVWYNSLREEGTKFVRKHGRRDPLAVRTGTGNLEILKSEYLRNKMKLYKHRISQANGYEIGLNDFLTCSSTTHSDTIKSEVKRIIVRLEKLVCEIWIDQMYLHVRNLGQMYFEWKCDMQMFSPGLLPGQSGLARLSKPVKLGEVNVNAAIVEISLLT